jgi:hypothetical protein
VSCTERLGQSGGSRLRKTTLLGEIKNRYFTKSWTVITNSVDDNPYTIQSSNLTPKLGDIYESDTVATAVEMRLSPQEDNFTWQLEVVYDTNRVVDLIIENPLNAPVEKKFHTEKFERPLRRDIRGLPLVTTANNPFAEPVTVPVNGTKITYIRNEAFYSDTLAAQYNGKINSVQFGEYPAFTVLSSISAERKIDNGIIYYQVTYEFTYDPYTYHLFLLDADYRNIRGAIFFDPTNGTPLSTVSLLDGNGFALRDWKNYLRLDVNATTNTWEFEDTDRMEFPAGPSKPPHWYFNLRCEDEVVTAVAGFAPNTGQLTVIRGVNGTTAAEHLAEAEVKLEPYYLKFDQYYTANFNSLGLI